MSRKLFLAPDHALREPLPFMVTHKEWCQHLSRIGQLALTHRPCLYADTCQAYKHITTGIEWRTRNI